MRQVAWGAAVMLLALACGDDEPGNSASAKDKLIDALGGEDTLASLQGLSIEGSGARRLPHEGLTPETPAAQSNTFERTVAIDLENDDLRIDTQRDIELFFPGSQSYTEVLQGELGASTEPFFGAPLGALGSDKAAAIRRQELLLTPQFLLRELDLDALVTESDVQLDGAKHHRLVDSSGPAPLTLYVNAETGLLSKLETQELDFYLRDVPLEVFYSDWQAAGGTSFPRELRLERGGETLLTEDVSDVTIDPSFAADTFEFPAGVTPALDANLFARGELSHQWYFLLDSIGLPFNGVDLSITPTELSPGVFHLVGGSHHSFLVEQEDGLVLVDAPLHDDRGKALFDYISANFPGKPITHVVASHFHEDHVSGIREVLGSTEAKLVVQESSEAFWEDLLAAPSTLKPDALEEHPRDVEIETVPGGSSLTLDDAEHPVTLYHVNTQHAADMLLVHESSSNVVFVVDLFSPGNPTQLAEEDFIAAVAAYDLPVAGLRVAGGHGTGVVDFATLQTQAP
jgi:glyoxylase-like metal-dependent hydrolase (beta-lactamase superfamily II)